jgi:hypothetical protein
MSDSAFPNTTIDIEISNPKVRLVAVTSFGAGDSLTYELRDGVGTLVSSGSLPFVPGSSPERWRATVDRPAPGVYTVFVKGNKGASKGSWEYTLVVDPLPPGVS